VSDGALRIPAPARAGILPRLGMLARVLAVFAIAATAGLGGTWLAVDGGVGFGAVRVGAWVAHPRNGSVDADPYSRAVVARSGVMPLGLGEGLTFTAQRDDAGRPLVGACEYRIAGFVPPTRYWTLTAQTQAGALIANPAGRHGFTSAEIVRGPDGSFVVTVAPSARPGNWLPVPATGRFDLVLRLYDTPISGASAVIDPARMPAVAQVACR
jgi:hypothetical protein